jgi:hypothetical protein
MVVVIRELEVSVCRRSKGEGYVGEMLGGVGGYGNGMIVLRQDVDMQKLGNFVIIVDSALEWGSF